VSAIEVHETAIIDPGAALEVGVRVGPYCIVEAGALIKRGTVLKPYVLVGPRAVVGEGCSIGAYTEIRGDCVLGDRVRLGSKCLLADGTRIGDDSHCSGTFTTCNKPEPGQHNPSVMGANFYAGVGVVIMPNVAIGQDVQVGASSTVRHNIPNGQVWFGNPAVKYR
jgi:UDP-2-acetamido-3-amino-2,3-dideoxy-glucuronate N-acetyltransferase